MRADIVNGISYSPKGRFIRYHCWKCGKVAGRMRQNRSIFWEPTDSITVCLDCLHAEQMTEQVMEDYSCAGLMGDGAAKVMHEAWGRIR